MINLPVQDPAQSNRIFANAQAPVVSRAILEWSGVEGPTTREPGSPERMAPMEDSLELQLYNNAAKLKQDFSVYAVHLNADWRKIVFSQLDDLLDLDG